MKASALAIKFLTEANSPRCCARDVLRAGQMSQVFMAEMSAVTQVDKMEKCGTMIRAMLQDIVRSSSTNTRSSGFAWQAGRWLVLVLLVSLLLACGSEDADKEAVKTDAPPPIVVETVGADVAPSAVLATEAPTAEPTITPTVTPPAPLAATVNGQYIFLTDYERQVAQYEQSLLSFGVDLATEDGLARMAQARMDILEGLINDALIGQGGAAFGVVVDEA